MTQQANRVPPIPEGCSTVMPWIISRDTARLLDFMKQAFGAQELSRIYLADGTIGHAEAKIGDSIVGGFDTREGWPETPCFLRLYVEDADAVYQQALSAGATAVTEMTSLVWGDRGGRVRDPLGNIWWIQTRVEQVDSEEMARRVAEKPYRDGLQYTRESLDREMKSRALGLTDHSACRDVCQVQVQEAASILRGRAKCEQEKDGAHPEVPPLPPDT